MLSEVTSFSMSKGKAGVRFNIKDILRNNTVMYSCPLRKKSTAHTKEDSNLQFLGLTLENTIYQRQLAQ